MRRVWIALAISCGHAAPAPAPTPTPAPEPPPKPARTCTDAAHGLAAATRGVREPESSVVEQLTARCTTDGWLAEVRECFATMREGELDRCARLLPPAQSAELLELLGARESLAQAREKLATITVGIGTCDDYVGAVKKALDCEGLAVDMRAQLGTEEANFWSIPMTRLDEAGKRQVAERCVRALDQLRAAVQGVCVL